MIPNIVKDMWALNIEVMSILANMTHFFQPLDLTVNGEAKHFMKDMFTTLYSTEVQKQMASGNSTEIEVNLTLSALKPLHAPDWWAFTITWKAVWDSGTLQKDGAKPKYLNLFKGRQPYCLMIHLALLRQFLSKC